MIRERSFEEKIAYLQGFSAGAKTCWKHGVDFALTAAEQQLEILRDEVESRGNAE